jgi:hypothetical protein
LVSESDLFVSIRNHSWGAFSMNCMLKTASAGALLALALSSHLCPARAANDNPLLAAGASTAAAGSLLARQAADKAVDLHSAALQQWRVLLTQNGPPDKGCFHASYPNAWEKVDCATARPRAHPTHVKSADDAPEVVGGGNDYVAYVTGLIEWAAGNLSISGVQSEQSVGGDQGILGPDEYSLQLNTNDRLTTHANGCSEVPGCKVWQQFLYATDVVKPGVAGVFMQYWMINWGPSCPRNWYQFGSDCYRNSAVTAVPDAPITDLGLLTLTGLVQLGGNDTAFFTWASEAWSTSAPDSMLDISTVWNKVEFNVLGDGGGSRADFNKGSSINVGVNVYDGSASPPTCLANAGTSGETNNLNLGSCEPGLGDVPFIQFSESN